MNRKVLGLVVVILLLIVGGFAYLAVHPAAMKTEITSMIPPTAVTESTQNTETETATTTPAEPGTYVNFTNDVIASTKGTKVLFFHAPWCPQCRELDADIKAGTVPSGVTIIKVDYDSNHALRQKYGVTMQTTFIKIDDNGNLLQKYVAYDEPSLEALKRNIL